MTIRSKAQPALTVDDDLNLQSVRLYRADAASTPPNHVRVECRARGNGTSVTIDRPLSDFSSLTGAQKTNLGNMLQALFAEAITLEGFS